MSNTGPLPSSGGDNRNLGPLLVFISYPLLSGLKFLLVNFTKSGDPCVQRYCRLMPFAYLGPIAMTLYGLT